MKSSTIRTFEIFVFYICYSYQVFIACTPFCPRKHIINRLLDIEYIIK